MKADERRQVKAQMTDLREQTLQSEPVYTGSFLHVQRDAVRLPNGHTSLREYIRHPGAVVIVPLLDSRTIMLERQYRHPVGKVMIEFPAGKLDQGETWLQCGKRELREETGCTATQWAYAATMHPAIGYADEVIHICFARGLHQGERQLDADESLDVFTMDASAFLRACQSGEITDGKTLGCALWLQNVQAGVWRLDWQDTTTQS
jgi:ADP-ribose pyrophosphatase